MTIHISMTQARDLAQMAIEERGADFVYVPKKGNGACAYFHEDGPGCIVGYILDRLGVDSAMLTEDIYNEASVQQLYDSDWISCDEQTLQYLLIMQETQDYGETWANAYLEAETILGFPAAVSQIEARPISLPMEEVPTDAA